MKLTTKRDWRYFRRETFTYMIPIILIVWTINVFFTFMQCPLHPEYSAPCNIIWINAAVYWLFLIITIIFAIFSSKKLKNVKKKIEVEFLKTTRTNENLQKKESVNTEENIEKVKETKPRKIIIKKNKKSEKKDTTDKKISKKITTKKTTTKKTVAKK